MHEEFRLSYAAPASGWNEALPIGNGRTGAMVFGDPHRERLQINDGTAWSGSFASELAAGAVTPSEARVALDAGRAAIRAEDWDAAEHALRGLEHRYTQAYQPFAEVTIAVDGGGAVLNEGYCRELRLDLAQHTTSHRRESGSVVQRTAVSRPDGVLLHAIETDCPQGLDLVVAAEAARGGAAVVDVDGVTALVFRLSSDVTPPHDAEWFRSTAEGIDPVYAGVHAMHGVLAFAWRHDGGADPANPYRAGNVHRAMLVVATETTFAGFDARPDPDESDAVRRAVSRCRAALEVTADELLARQGRDHEELFGRSVLRLDVPPPARNPGQRVELAHTRGIASDPGLLALLFHFGRYLLICSSRPGGVPPNLQGIWNADPRPEWSSGYTTNINLQMNHWPAAVTGIGECLEPLWDFTIALANAGAITARRLYDSPGWVVHHNSDIWLHSSPIGGGRHPASVATWSQGSAWLAAELWWQYRILGPDPSVLRRIRPVIRSAAEFVLHRLQSEREGGPLGTSPSSSPENFFLRDGVETGLGTSATIDLELARAVLVACAEAHDGAGDPLALRAMNAANRIPAPRITPAGLVQEIDGDPEPLDPRHRHLSHLLWLYPGNAAADSELLAAAAASLDARGADGAGWSVAWKLCLRARLRDATALDPLLAVLFRPADDRHEVWGGGGLYRNLLAAHPPFQIDGNLGFSAAVAEFLMQSHRGEIELLPCAPRALPDGSFTGLIAVGGIEVDAEWRSGRVSRVGLRTRSGTAQNVKVLVNGRRITIPSVGQLVQHLYP